MLQKNNYDNIAFAYDRLSRLMFGNSIQQSQICLLSYITSGSKILIVGGGSGWILEEITRLHPSGLSIVYIEASEKMTKLAKAKNIAENKVDFLNIYLEQFETTAGFDIIITSFLFDNFNETTALESFNKLDALLNKKGKWLFVDYVLNKESSYFHKLLLQTMYWFFRLVSNVQAKYLVDMNPLFLKSNYEAVFSRYFYNQFIKSVCWVKQ